MRLYGLIGYPLGHSFSKGYFTEKFEKEGLGDCAYENFEIPTPNLLSKIVSKNPDLRGLNVTIPHKQTVIEHLDRLDPAAEKIGAVNVIKIEDDRSLTGFNSDYFGFKRSLSNFLTSKIDQALVLGTGGASKAVIAALKDMGIKPTYVSRNNGPHKLSYDQLDKLIMEANKLIINTTPLGMHPNEDNAPDIPYELLTKNHFLYDLVYNPEETLFMKMGKEKGAQTINGLPMLHGQAEKAWEIWNS